MKELILLLLTLLITSLTACFDTNTKNETPAIKARKSDNASAIFTETKNWTRTNNTGVTIFTAAENYLTLSIFSIKNSKTSESAAKKALESLNMGFDHKVKLLTENPSSSG